MLPAPDSGIPVLEVHEVLVSAGNVRSAHEALEAEVTWCSSVPRLTIRSHRERPAVLTAQRRLSLR